MGGFLRVGTRTTSTYTRIGRHSNTAGSHTRLTQRPWTRRSGELYWRGGAGGAGVDGEADGAEDAVAGGAIPFHVGAGAAVEFGLAGGEEAELERVSDLGK